MKKHLYIFRTLFFTIMVSSVLLPALLLAQTSGGNGGIVNPIKAKTFVEFANGILDVVIQIGYVVVVFFIVYSGFLFVKARGNAEELSTAKTAFLWTVIGAAILLGAKVLETAVQNTIDSLK